MPFASLCVDAVLIEKWSWRVAMFVRRFTSWRTCWTRFSWRTSRSLMWWRRSFCRRCTGRWALLCWRMGAPNSTSRSSTWRHSPHTATIPHQPSQVCHHRLCCAKRELKHTGNWNGVGKNPEMFFSSWPVCLTQEQQIRNRLFCGFLQERCQQRCHNSTIISLMRRSCSGYRGVSSYPNTSTSLKESSQISLYPRWTPCEQSGFSVCRYVQKRGK